MLKRSLSGGESPPEKASLKKTKTVKDDDSDLNCNDGTNSSLEDPALLQSDRELTDSVLKDVPPDTPPWGKHILIVMKQDFNILTRQIADLKIQTENAETTVKNFDDRLSDIEQFTI